MARSPLNAPECIRRQPSAFGKIPGAFGNMDRVHLAMDRVHSVQNKVHSATCRVHSASDRVHLATECIRQNLPGIRSLLNSVCFDLFVWRNSQYNILFWQTLQHVCMCIALCPHCAMHDSTPTILRETMKKVALHEKTWDRHPSNEFCQFDSQAKSSMKCNVT